MKKRKLILLCIPLLLVCLLTACHAMFGVEAALTHLPKGTTPAFLVPDTDISQDMLRIAEDNIKPRCTYHQDGWIALTMLRSYDEYFSQSGVLKAVYGGGSKNDAISMCERFRSVRIAAVDAEGKTVAVSDEIPIHEDGKLYAVRNFTYDWETGEMEINSVYRLKWHGYTADEWWFYSMLAAQIAGFIALIVILINALCNKKENAGLIEWITVACAAVPFLIMNVLYLVIRLSSVFSPNPERLGSGDILLLALCNLMLLVLLGGVGTHSAVRRNKEKGKMYYESH